MKQSTKSVIALLMCIITLFTFAACSGEKTNENNGESVDSLWNNAIYKEDTTVGEGEKVFSLKVTVNEKSIILTVNTDKNTVGEALEECEVIRGEEGPFGIFISHVNGIKAVYEEDGAYWGFKKDGEMLNAGADSTEIEIGAEYELAYTKA